MCIPAREKIALLIGNQNYDAPDLNMLQFTEEEVRDVAEKLKQLHFKVQYKQCTLIGFVRQHCSYLFSHFC